MFTYCEPWPVYRNATFGAGPEPRKIPCARKAFQAAGWFAASAFSALPALVGQFGGVGVIDGDALGCAQIRFRGRCGRRGCAGLCVGLYRAQPLSKCGRRRPRRSRARRAAALCRSRLSQPDYWRTN